MLGKFNFLCSFHIWVSFLKIYGFNDYNKFYFLACEQLTCLCIIYPALVVIDKLSWEELGNKVLNLHWILNVIWVIDISGWLSSLQFFSVTLLVMEIKPRLFYRVVKIQGRPWPLKILKLAKVLSKMTAFTSGKLFMIISTIYDEETCLTWWGEDSGYNVGLPADDLDVAICGFTVWLHDLAHKVSVVVVLHSTQLDFLAPNIAEKKNHFWK